MMMVVLVALAAEVLMIQTIELQKILSDVGGNGSDPQPYQKQYGWFRILVLSGIFLLAGGGGGAKNSTGSGGAGGGGGGYVAGDAQNEFVWNGENGGDGQSGTGGGGGGPHSPNPQNFGGSGGSGVVLIAYPT